LGALIKGNLDVFCLLQSFAKGLLDVADNLGRAAVAVPEEFRKSDGPEDPSGAAKLLISLLLGVEMTEKQLIQVFKANGLERYESLGDPFDPNLHSAVFEVEDLSKTPGTVAIVLKVGYKLHDRVIRPAEVGVVKAQ
jgi:molecular chaperone GrpE